MKGSVGVSTNAIDTGGVYSFAGALGSETLLSAFQENFLIAGRQEKNNLLQNLYSALQNTPLLIAYVLQWEREYLPDALKDEMKRIFNHLSLNSKEYALLQSVVQNLPEDSFLKEELLESFPTLDIITKTRNDLLFTLSPVSLLSQQQIIAMPLIQFQLSVNVVAESFAALSEDEIFILLQALPPEKLTLLIPGKSALFITEKIVQKIFDNFDAFPVENKNILTRVFYWRTEKSGRKDLPLSLQWMYEEGAGPYAAFHNNYRSKPVNHSVASFYGNIPAFSNPEKKNESFFPSPSFLQCSYTDTGRYVVSLALQSDMTQEEFEKMVAKFPNNKAFNQDGEVLFVKTLAEVPENISAVKTIITTEPYSQNIPEDLSGKDVVFYQKLPSDLFFKNPKGGTFIQEDGEGEQWARYSPMKHRNFPESTEDSTSPSYKVLQEMCHLSIPFKILNGNAYFSDQQTSEFFAPFAQAQEADKVKRTLSKGWMLPAASSKKKKKR